MNNKKIVWLRKVLSQTIKEVQIQKLPYRGHKEDVFLIWKSL